MVPASTVYIHENWIMQYFAVLTRRTSVAVRVRALRRNRKSYARQPLLPL